MIFKSRSALPGFGLTMGYTVTYLLLIILLPVAGLFLKTAELGIPEIWSIISSGRVITALWLSFSTALVAASLNAVFGTLIAWVFVRYEFPGKRLLDAMIDLPFAMPTAVAGIALSTLYSENGLIGQWLEPLGIKVTYTPLGIIVALTFIGLPFVVRTIEPVLREMDKELEVAAASLGANRFQTILGVVLPSILPALLTGFTLAFARGLGEYGSVIFIAGNLPYVSEIVPLLILIRLEEFDYAGATAIGAMMLTLAFLFLLAINGIQSWGARYRNGTKRSGQTRRGL
ncbi:sulfate ABC transporter permease subunit CysT [Deltaproteobacteria bacterium TL4]